MSRRPQPVHNLQHEKLKLRRGVAKQDENLSNWCTGKFPHFYCLVAHRTAWANRVVRRGPVDVQRRKQMHRSQQTLAVPTVLVVCLGMAGKPLRRPL